VRDDPRPLSQQVHSLLQDWHREVVRPWKFAMLIARSFQAITADIDPAVFSPADGADALVWWVIESARRRSAGGRLADGEIGQARQWIAAALSRSYRRTRDQGRTWIKENMSHWVHALGLAMINPRVAAIRIVSQLINGGSASTPEQEPWLKAILRISNCLHPGRPVVIDPRWRTADVSGVALGVHEDHAFDRLPILADALMDAGCDDEGVLGHCLAGGRHAEGCWLVDSLLPLWAILGGRANRTGLFRFGMVGHWEPRPGGAGKPNDCRARLAEGMDAISRLGWQVDEDLLVFGLTGVIRDESHRSALVAALTRLVQERAALPVARPLIRLLEVLPSAPVGVRYQV
jgi:hypothetical protein